MSEKQPWEIWQETVKTVYKSKENIYGRHGVVQIGQSKCEVCDQNTTIMCIDTSAGEYRDFACCKPCMMKLWEQTVEQPEEKPDYSEIAKTQLEAAKTEFNRSLKGVALDAVHKLWNESQKPVAWMNNDYEVFFDAKKAACYSMGWIKPLYTKPPKREWVGLTDEVIWDIKMKGRDLEGVSRSALMRFAREIEAASKEINT